jgi:hypothetical protein
MLRWTVAVLIAANLLFFAWTRGWLDPLVGVDPQGDREPQRLQRQVHPERVQVQPLTASEADAPDDDAASAPARTEPFSTAASEAAAVPGTAGVATGTEGHALACLEAGPFDPGDLQTAEAALRNAGLAPQHWQRLPVAAAPVWLVYMGRFADAATLQHKEAELQRIHVGFDEVQAAPALEPGLSLGRFGDEAAAQDALARLAQRGVRTARVVALKAPSAQQLLRAARLEPALVKQLQSQPWPLPGHRLHPCSATTAAIGSAAASAG